MSGKGVTLLFLHPLRTGLESSPSSGSSRCEAPLLEASVVTERHAALGVGLRARRHAGFVESDSRRDAGWWVWLGVVRGRARIDSTRETAAVGVVRGGDLTGLQPCGVGEQASA